MMFERIAPEQNDTLDGIPEPSENPFLVGHEATGAVLAAAYRGGKLPHALIFAGPQGVGKATLAFHLAYHLLKNPSSDSAPADFSTPDAASALYRQIAIGAHPAVLHLTRPYDEKAKRFKTVVAVDEIRRVSRFLSLKTHDGGYRIVIVDPADDMNASAANALLKNLEEPPSRTVFVLIAHAPGALLPTIRSRCRIFRLAPLSAGDLAAALAALGLEPPVDEQGRAALAQRAGGSVRMAILLTQYGGLEIAEAIDRIAMKARFDVPAAHKVGDAVSGRDQSIQFEIFNLHALDLLSGEASAAARGGHASRADLLSESWGELRTATDEAETYNLDRKQHVLNTLARLNGILRM